jgi:hypothetical protein
MNVWRHRHVRIITFDLSTIFIILWLDISTALLEGRTDHHSSRAVPT